MAATAVGTEGEGRPELGWSKQAPLWKCVVPLKMGECGGGLLGGHAKSVVDMLLWHGKGRDII